MNKDFERFMQSYESKSINTYNLIKSHSVIGDYNYTDCDVEDLEKFILEMNPKSEKVIDNICSVLKAYAKFINDDKFYFATQCVNKRELWVKAKQNAPQKFISNKKFEEVYKKIGLQEDFNPLYYQTLFRCIYEGIYTDKMDVLKNLRASDIHGNIVTLHEDSGYSYNMEISKELTANLIELSSVKTWVRKNRYGAMDIQIEGLYPDSCFKFETRKEDSHNFYHSYCSRLRKIVKEYIGYSILPFHLYISGIAYRIALKMKEYDTDLERVINSGNRNDMAKQIIIDEFKRCNCNTSLPNFKFMIRGYLELFKVE